MPTDPRRERDLGDFFTRHCDRLHRTVASQVRGLADAAIEDACQAAWTILVRRSDIPLNERGLAWLTTVAIREAWRLGADARAEQPSGANVDPEEGGMAPEPTSDAPDVVDQVADRAEHDQRIEDLRALKPEQTRALWLHGLGYSYAEIQQITDATRTAVNRRITEGRQQLRRRATDRENE